MHVAEFAERILLGDSLDDKLLQLDALDDAPFTGWACAPDMPGRPAFLVPTSHPVDPRRWDSDEGRAHLLHAFANHELLAIELIALALLRFPDAPAGFRYDLLRTLGDEQRHLGRYLARLDALGFAFGSAPVNAHFWRRMADMQAPVDFTVRMSLTFEQANLDHATWYRDAYRSAGDHSTADLLDEVLRDEIRHVAAGVSWLDASRRPDESRFEAYRRLLPEDLSPVRARGRRIARDARREAGLEEAFIDELEAVAWQPGRQAVLWRANLDAELRLADQPANRAVRDVVSDLASLVGFLARPDDVVVVPSPPALAWRTLWRREVAPLPSFVEQASEVSVTVGSVEPWARTVHGTTPGPPGATVPDALPLSVWSKASSVRVGLQLWDEHPQLHAWFGPREAQGVVCETHGEVVDALCRLRQLGFEEALFKPPIGNAGRGHRRVPSEAAVSWRPPWLTAWLEAGLPVTVEPVLDRRVDLSVLVPLDPEAPLRVRRALVDGRGRYQGHVLGPAQRALPTAYRRMWHDGGDRPPLGHVLDELARALCHHLRAMGVAGPASIDMGLWFPDPSGSPMLRPVFEINPRWTMGHVAMTLEAAVHPGSWAVWRHHALRQVPDIGLERFSRLTRHPGTGRLVQASLPTCDPGQAKRLLPVLWVSPSPDAADARASANPGADA